MTQILDQRGSELAIGESVVESVQANTQLLQQLLIQVSDLNQRLSSVNHSPPVLIGAEVSPEPSSAGGPEPLDLHRGCEAERTRLEDQIADLESQLAEFESHLGDLRQQNRDLAAKVAIKNVRDAISDGGVDQSLSWEQRKQLMLQQMESESFDAESFVGNMPYQREDERETPELFLERLVRELESRNREVEELRHLLDQQALTRDGQIALGAAAIAEMIDSDELVRQERQRLQSLQSEWEEKFREGEIEASLERAKLSRERQELARRQTELNEELEHIRRALRDRERCDSEGPKPSSSRRWLVKLGLSDQS